MSAVVIAGGGITGLLTAIRCAAAGHRVTVVDRGPIPNPGSSSFDQHRVVRALAPDDATATKTAAALQGRWLRLQNMLGGQFYRRIGVVTGVAAERADDIVEAARLAGMDVTALTPDAMPHIVFPPGHVGVREADAGVLLAERVLHAATRWLRDHPAVTLLPWRTVAAVDTGNARLRLADNTSLTGDLVLLAAGAWTGALVDVPTVLHRQTMVYLRPPADLAGWWEQAPTAGNIGADGTGWLMPPATGTLLKLSSTALCRTVAQLTDPVEDRTAARHYIDQILTEPHRYTVAAIKHCHYTVDAATGGAALTRLGPAVWARAATGGDGFRTAPLIADHIAHHAAAPLAA